jgi:hypothetical protein
MVRDGFGDESGAKLIEQRGIDFAPSEDFILPFVLRLTLRCRLVELQMSGVPPSHRWFHHDLRTRRRPRVYDDPTEHAIMRYAELARLALSHGHCPRDRRLFLRGAAGSHFEEDLVATVSDFLTVGFSHTRIPNSKGLLLAAGSRFGKEEPAVRKALTAATNLLCLRFPFDDKPTANSQDELAMATAGSRNLRRRSNG